MNDTRSTVRYPTKKSLEAELAALTVTDLRSTVATITAAIERDRAGSTRADGYPRASSGAGVPGGSTGLPSSSVERAALVLVTAARATADAAEHDTDLEQCLRDMVTATGPLRTGDTDIEVLMKLLDIRTRACELLDLDPAGHDWTHTPSTDDAPTP